MTDRPHRAKPADLPRLTSFLRDHLATSMFPLSNLHAHGLDGDHPRGTSFWITESAGQITGALGLTNAGMVMPQCPGPIWPAARSLLSGRELNGVCGPADQARSLMSDLGCADWAMALDTDERLMTLELSDLVQPPGNGQIIPMRDADQTILTDWTIDYLVETLGTDPATARAEAADRVKACGDSHVVLMVDDQPVAMSGFNARVPGAVQVGGVYTPPDLRGRGYARTCVAGHLAAARDRGDTTAILFTNSEPAGRAYRAIGFAEVGKFTLALFRDRQVLHG